jgi:4-hydroxy-tetrahydrodipicolinate reductase
MGQAIAQAIDSHDDLRLTYLWSREGRMVDCPSIPPDKISGDLERIVSTADVLIDFSLPSASAQILSAVAVHRKPLVCGVSGLDEAQLAELNAAAAVAPIVYDRNMSVGVAVLDELVRLAAQSLGSEFEVDIHETHHVHKKDAPSGTALKLGEAVAEVRGQDFQQVAWYAPVAGDKAPSAGDIRFDVERRGEVPGDHAVGFKSATEQLELTHSVTTRQVFADGAVRAALWVVNQQPGRYSMKDVLFGRAEE